MLSAAEDVDATVTQSNVVVEQYSAAAEQQYLAPVQSELQAALEAFLAGTAASASTIGVDQTTADTSLGAFSGVFGNTSAGVTAESQQVLGAVSSSEIPTSGTAVVMSGSGDGVSSSTSLFAPGPQLQTFADTLGTSAFGTFGANSGTTAGTGAPASDTTPSSGAGGSTSTGASGSTSTGSGDSSSSNGVSSSGGGWQPFVLPAGIVFDDVHLPAEQFAGNWSLLQPTGPESFSNTTITESSVAGTTTKLTVTLSQTFLDAEHWIVSQSWTKAYRIHESAGESSGSWSESTRQGATTLSITVSLGYGVPARPDIGRQPLPSTSNSSGSSNGSASGSSNVNGSASGSSNGSASGASATGGSLSPASPSVVPVGVVSTVSFSTNDSLTNSVGGSHDASDAATGKVDSGSFSGSSSVSAAKILVLTNFDVLQPDGTLGHTIQLSAADQRTAAMSFKGGNTLFEAKGNVKDGDGNTTNNNTNPFGTPFSSPGSKPPTNGDDFFDGTAPLPAMGGDGSRVDASAGIAVSSSFSTGSYFLAEATTAIGADLEEADITGTAGMHTDYDGSIAVNDSLSLDVQSSDAATGDFDYLSLGWQQAADARRDLRFRYDMDLSDADLPDLPASDSGNSNSAPMLPTSPPNGTAPPPDSSGTTPSGTSASPGTPSIGATSGGSAVNGTPSFGQPTIELTSHSFSGDSGKIWVQAPANKTELLPTASTAPGATPIQHTEQSMTSVRIAGDSRISTSMTLVNWVPTVSVTAQGNLDLSFYDAKIESLEWGFDTAPPSGFAMTVSEKKDTYKTSTAATAVVHFDLGLSLSAAAAPNLTGTVTIAASLEERGEGRHFFHEQIVNLGTGAPFEKWELGVTIHRGSTTITGDAGNLPTSTNQLTTTTTNQDFGYGLTDSTGTPPPPPPPRTDSLTEALDFLQTGLDAAGLVPVLGEAADAISAGISAGRGNFGEAALSMAAMIPFAGAGVTAGKFANKATKAVAKNADKLDDVAAATQKMAAVRAAGQAGEMAAGISDPKKRILGPISGKWRFPDEFSDVVLKESKNVKKQGWTAQLKDYSQMAKDAGVPFELWVRPDTVLSGPLKAARDGGQVTIEYLEGL